tara:strand:- start:3365 stop:3697 length:333 start_codon:yes stop_codon:yes gene_type:complete
MASTTFRDAYGVLQKHADSLRNQREPDIDNLLTIVTESVVAYKVCKERIDAVEKALAQALSNVGVESAVEKTASDEGDWLDDSGQSHSHSTYPHKGVGGAPDSDVDDIPF